MSDLKKRLQREMFLVRPWSILINPFFIIRRGIYQGIQKHASSMKGDVLDFGCGSKPYEHLFLNAKSYVGVDIEKSGHNHENSKIDYFYDGRSLPFKESEFDAVVSFEVLHHLFNLSEITKEIHRVIKPGGNLLITIPFAWDEHEQPFDFARYTSFGITSLIEEAGFHVISVEKTTKYVEAVGQLMIAFVSQHVGPKNLILAAIFQLLVIFPLSLLVLIFKLILPRRDEMFCNLVVLATAKK